MSDFAQWIPFKSDETTLPDDRFVVLLLQWYERDLTGTEKLCRVIRPMYPGGSPPFDHERATHYLILPELPRAAK